LRRFGEFMMQEIVRSPFAGKSVPVATSDGINIVTGSKQ
jgi:hypothetical protein